MKIKKLKKQKKIIQTNSPQNFHGSNQKICFSIQKEKKNTKLSWPIGASSDT